MKVLHEVQTGRGKRLLAPIAAKTLRKPHRHPNLFVAEQGSKEQIGNNTRIVNLVAREQSIKLPGHGRPGF